MTTDTLDAVQPAASAPAAPAPAAPPAAAKPVGIPETGMHSVESERMVISLMLNPARTEIHHRLHQLLSSDDFFVEQNQAIWSIIGTLRDAGLSADSVAINDHASTHDAFVGGVAYLVDVVNDPFAKVCTDEAGLAAASRIKGFALTRRLQKSLETALTLCKAGQTFDQVSSYVQDDLIQLGRSSDNARSGPQLAQVFYDKIMAQHAAKEAGLETTSFVSTGFSELDIMLNGGLPPESLIVLAGRPAMGKTAMASAIEQNISGRGYPTLFFSLEMPGTQIAQRNLSHHSRIPLTRVQTVDFQEQDFEALGESLDLLNGMPCYIDETPGLTVSEIRSRSRTFAEKNPKCVIFVDYMQKIKSLNPKADARMAVMEASEGLLELARELKVPVVALAQVNRDLEKRTSKRPVMADLKESGQIEQDAAVILFVYRDEYYNPETADAGITELIGGKNRSGPTDTIKFAHALSTMSYTEVGRTRGME